MDKFEVKKQELVVEISKALLEHGIRNSSLKSLAKAADTSDRMLLHYFKDKDELMNEALVHISRNMMEQLKEDGHDRMTFPEFAVYTSKFLRRPQLKCFVDLCAELIGLCKDKQEPYYTIIRQIMKAFQTWVGAMVVVEDETSREKIMNAALVMIEGFIVFKVIDFEEELNQAVEGISVLSNQTSVQ